MILAFFSDIHSNCWALDSAVQCARKTFGQDVRFCVLGDVINYGPRPVECLHILKQLDEEGSLYNDEIGNIPFLLKGNHEHAWQSFEKTPGIVEKILLGSDRRADINRLAMILHSNQSGNEGLKQVGVFSLLLNMVVMQTDPNVLNWYRQRINEKKNERMQMEKDVFGNWKVDLMHGSLRNPLTEGIYSFEKKETMQQYFRMCNVCTSSPRTLFLHGHTHVPMWFSLPDPVEQSFVYGQKLLLKDTIHLLNPGSIGLPRDHDARPSFLVLDFSSIDFNSENVSACFVRVPLVNEAGEDEFGYDAGRKELIDILKREKYPEQIQDWFENAYLWQFGEYGPTPEQIEFLLKLKRRAGKNWIPPKGINL